MRIVSYKTKCGRCGKQLGHHKAESAHCPVGEYHPVLTYTSFSATERFQAPRKPRTQIKRTPIRRKTSARRKKQVIDCHIKKQVIERDGDRCARCGGASPHAHHVLPKGSYPRLRFAQLNIILLCYRCHLHFAHKDPLAFAAWFNETYPGREEKLRRMAHEALKVDLEALYLEAQ